MTDPRGAVPLTVEQAALRRRARELADSGFRERAAHWDKLEEYGRR